LSWTKNKSKGLRPLPNPTSSTSTYLHLFFNSSIEIVDFYIFLRNSLKIGGGRWRWRRLGGGSGIEKNILYNLYDMFDYTNIG
jgi:hypothetical protein